MESYLFCCSGPFVVLIFSLSHCTVNSVHPPAHRTMDPAGQELDCSWGGSPSHPPWRSLQDSSQCSGVLDLCPGGCSGVGEVPESEWPQKQCAPNEGVRVGVAERQASIHAFFWGNSKVGSTRSLRATQWGSPNWHNSCLISTSSIPHQLPLLPSHLYIPHHRFWHQISGQVCFKGNQIKAFCSLLNPAVFTHLPGTADAHKKYSCTLKVLMHLKNPKTEKKKKPKNSKNPTGGLGSRRSQQTMSTFPEFGSKHSVFYWQQQCSF